ncbi:MAG: hypothetical protein AW07_00499 [Candidatus Accumulibacter sp. SK-11]|nr:MAG: hypothetical protein AW07_00499 [Candidatus Accumulibacter sp. SK-11]
MVAVTSSAMRSGEAAYRSCSQTISQPQKALANSSRTTRTTTRSSAVLPTPAASGAPASINAAVAPISKSENRLAAATATRSLRGSFIAYMPSSLRTSASSSLVEKGFVM